MNEVMGFYASVLNGNEAFASTRLFELTPHEAANPCVCAHLLVYAGRFRGAPGYEGARTGASQPAPAPGGQHQGGQSHESGLAPGLRHGAHRAAAAAEERPPQPQGTSPNHTHTHTFTVNVLTFAVWIFGLDLSRVG